MILAGIERGDRRVPVELIQRSDQVLGGDQCISVLRNCELIAFSSILVRHLDRAGAAHPTCYGVEEYYEYYLYDPDRNSLNGWLRTDKFLDVIEPINQWVSPRLKIRFEPGETELQVYHPDGTRFLTYTEIAQRAEKAARLAERLRELGIDPD